MGEAGTAIRTTAANAPELKELPKRYGCGPVQFTGTNDALCEHHLLFDNVIEPAAASPRGCYEAVARSERDIFSERWIHTERTFEHKDPKRVYYLSMEFLISRSLANNVLRSTDSRTGGALVHGTSSWT